MQFILTLPTIFKSLAEKFLSVLNYEVTVPGYGEINLLGILGGATIGIFIILWIIRSFIGR